MDRKTCLFIIHNMSYSSLHHSLYPNTTDIPTFTSHHQNQTLYRQLEMCAQERTTSLIEDLDAEKSRFAEEKDSLISQITGLSTENEGKNFTIIGKYIVRQKVNFNSVLKNYASST